MYKQTTRWLFIIGIVLAIVGGGINGVGIVRASTKGIILTGGILGGFGFLLALVSLVPTGKQGHWGWFMLVFLLTVISELITLIGVVLAPK